MFKALFGGSKNNSDLFELLQNENVQIIDVRTEGEFQNGHASNSKNIPVDKIPNLIDDFKTMPKPIILCCASGARSGRAVDYLKQFGVEDIYNGGSWKDVELQQIK